MNGTLVLVMANFGLLDKSHQPRNFAFPCRVFGKKNPMKRAFRSDWFVKWKCQVALR